jgi:hypothetical protein
VGSLDRLNECGPPALLSLQLYSFAVTLKTWSQDSTRSRIGGWPFMQVAFAFIITIVESAFGLTSFLNSRLSGDVLKRFHPPIRTSISHSSSAAWTLPRRRPLPALRFPLVTVGRSTPLRPALPAVELDVLPAVLSSLQMCRGQAGNFGLFHRHLAG